MISEQVCGPEDAYDWGPSWYSVVDGCACPADWRAAGCASTTTDAGVRFEPLVARCDACGPEAVCASRDTMCALFEVPLEPTSLTFVSWSEPISFEAAPGGDDTVICQP
jgi:hypothetical protein